MRINKYVAQASTLSRRAADLAIAEGRVLVNGQTAGQGYDVSRSDTVTLDGRAITPAVNTITIMLNKPVGSVCSRNGQGSPTIYDLLLPDLQQLNPVGRLDKDSSGLLLMTNDGTLAHELTHPSRQKNKVYEVTLDKPLQPLHQQMITDHGIQLTDGVSQFLISRIGLPARSAGAERSEAGEEQADASEASHHLRRGKPLLTKDSTDSDSSHDIYQITMHEGRNRQIRRTFATLGYTVTTLHRTNFGPYALGGLAPGDFTEL